MRSMINDSEEFQAALIYPERARPKRGVSPRWRTVAIIGWIVVGILTALTALSARGADFAGCADLALQPTAPHHRAACPAEQISPEQPTRSGWAGNQEFGACFWNASAETFHSYDRAAGGNFQTVRRPLLSALTPAPVAGVSPATEPDLAGCPPTFAARRHRGILSVNFGGVVPALAGPPTGFSFPDSSGQRL